MCTIFGLEDEEVQILIDSGLRMTDHNIDDEGYEVEISAFKVNKNLYLNGFQVMIIFIYRNLTYHNVQYVYHYIQLMRELGKLLGFEPLPSQTVCTDAPGGRKTLIWTLFKDIEK